MDVSLTADEPDLANLRRMVTDAQDLTQQAREEARKDRKYYDGRQLSEADKRRLRTLRRAPCEENWVRFAVDGMVGVLERGKTDPRTYPRTPQDEMASEVATDTLRYICDTTRWNRRKLDGARNIFIEGVAAVIIEVEKNLDVNFRRIRAEEFIYDPHSREADFSDAGYMGFAKWMDQQAVIALYPEKAQQIRDYGGMADAGGSDWSWNDRPENATRAWNDPKRRRMLVVELYHLEGTVWMRTCFIGRLVLEHGPSPYLDGSEDPQPCNPIEAQSCYVDDENNRYGVVRDMRGPQDEINKRLQDLLAFGSNRQLQETVPGQGEVDPEEARREAARPDGVIPSGWQVVPTTDLSVASVQLLQRSQAYMERRGPSPAMLGRQGENSSGRQNLIRQQAGLTELADLFGGIADWELRIFRQGWARVRQYWKAPKFIRVTDDENAFRFVQLNEPVYETGADGQPVMYPQFDPATGMPLYDPATRQVVAQPHLLGVRNPVSEMNVDIIVDTVPDTANVQQEQFDSLVELAKMGALGPNPGPILLEASSLPKKKQIMDKMEQAVGQPPPPNPAEVAAARLADAKAGHLEAQTGKTAAQTEEIKVRTVRDFQHGVREAQAPAMLPAPASAEPMLTGWMNQRSA